LQRLQEVRRKREEQRIKCEAEGRKPGWTQNGLDEDSDGSDNEHEKKTAAASAAAPDPNSVAARKKAAAMGPSEEEAAAAGGAGGIPKLSAIEIKKLNADGLKEHLKVRGLSAQGQKKDLMKRLIDYEATRE
jgi:hypothetical protein